MSDWDSSAINLAGAVTIKEVDEVFKHISVGDLQQGRTYLLVVHKNDVDRNAMVNISKVLSQRRIQHVVMFVDNLDGVKGYELIQTPKEKVKPQ